MFFRVGEYVFWHIDVEQHINGVELINIVLEYLLHFLHIRKLDSSIVVFARIW